MPELSALQNKTQGHKGGLITGVERLQAYRQHLLKAGKLLEARAVARCIDLVKKEKPLI